jgi:serine/threonine-protein kinase
MATVYLAHDLALDRKVAVKVMSPEQYAKHDMAERFKREARTAAGVSHPHIIPIYSVREVDDLVFFVMKYVEGRPLDVIISNGGALPIPIVHAILSQVGSALDFAHRHRIVHRDIKPANILIDEDGWAMVTDFGIAKVAQTRGLTMTGGTMGTPTYMSPEQCVGGEITGASDQYSLGIVAYQMLVGELPFEADTVMSSMWAHVNEPPRPVQEARPDCPEAMAGAISRMLEKQPARRWPQVADAIESMGPLQESQDDMTQASMVRLATSTFRESRKSGQERVPQIKAPDTVPTDTVNKRVAFVTVFPPVGRLAAGETLQLRASVRGPDGSELNRPVNWTTTNPLVAKVSNTGTVIGVAEGGTTIKAGSEGAVDACSITVTPPPVGSVRVTPTHETLRMMGALRLSFQLYDEHGNHLPPRRVSWVSSDPGVASVAGDGRVVGIRPGRVLVAATIEGKRGVCVVNVTPIPLASVVVTPREAVIGVAESIQLSGEPLDERGMPLGDRHVTWSSADPAVASVSDSGVVSGVSVGSAKVHAKCEDMSIPVEVTVKRVPLSVLVAEPSTGAMVVEQRFQFTAEPQDASGRVLVDRAVAWRSTDPQIVEITPSGLATAISSGSAHVVAHCEGHDAKISINVTRVGVASVEANSPVRNLEVGDEVDLRVKTHDQFGRQLERRFIQWTSSDPTVARVTLTGRVIALRTGSVIITAASGRYGDEVQLTVKPPSFARLNIRPARCSMPEGWQKQLSAVIISPDGDTVSEVDCEWSVNDPAIATVSPTGVVTTHAPGSVMVAAESDGKRATARIVVTAVTADES